MSAIRLAVAALLVGFAWYTSYVTVFRPFGCSRVKAVTERATLALWSAGTAADDYVRITRARQHLDTIAPCLHHSPEDLDFLLLQAANMRLLGRNAEAVSVYRKAIAAEERPEIDFSLGETQLELGHRAEAVRAFTRAALFNPSLTYEISDSSIMEEVRLAVIQHDDALRQRTAHIR